MDWGLGPPALPPSPLFAPRGLLFGATSPLLCPLSLFFGRETNLPRAKRRRNVGGLFYGNNGNNPETTRKQRKQPAGCFRCFRCYQDGRFGRGVRGVFFGEREEIT